MPVFKLIRNVAIAHDRARDKLREECDICTEIHGVLLNGCVVAVNIDNIAHCLEGIERNAYGQRYYRRCIAAHERKNGFQRVNNKACVFEYAQQRKVQHNGSNEYSLAAFFVVSIFSDKQTGKPVERYGEYHQKHKTRFAPAVENKAENTEDYVSINAIRHCIIQCQSYNKIDEDEQQT